MKRILSLLLTLAFLSSGVLLASATEFKRKFNPEYSAKSSFKNGMVVMEFSKPKDMCWTYVPGATDLEFQFRVNGDEVEAEFDWLGINITNDGNQLLGQGNGLSTIIWRLGDGINSRVVEESLAWDAAVVKEIHSGSLYDEKNPPPEEDFRFGYGSWITFSMKKTGSSWDVKVNGISIVKNRYKDFDKDMSRLLENKEKITLTFFNSGTPALIELKSFQTSSAVTSSAISTSSATRSTAASSKPSSGTASVGSQNPASEQESQPTQSVDSDEPQSGESDETGSVESTDPVSSTALTPDKNGPEKGVSPGVWIGIAAVILAAAIAAFLLIKKNRKK